MKKRGAAPSGPSGAVVLLPDGEDIVLTGASPEGVTLAPDAMAAARWAWTHGEVAGHGTGTLPQTCWRFQPLQGVRARAGIVPGFDLVRAQSLAAEAQSRLDAIAGAMAGCAAGHYYYKHKAATAAQQKSQAAHPAAVHQ